MSGVRFPHRPHMKKYFTTNILVQVGLVVFTILGYLLTSLKIPQFGLIAALISQIFWIYSSHKAWKQAEQVGIFIVTIVITVIVLFGVINYWFF